MKYVYIYIFGIPFDIHDSLHKGIQGLFYLYVVLVMIRTVVANIPIVKSLFDYVILFSLKASLCSLTISIVTDSIYITVKLQASGANLEFYNSLTTEDP